MTDPQVVVGAAIFSDGRVLAARRSTPPVGRWELPGGKVDSGETADQALVREIREEFGVGFTVAGWLDDEAVIRPGLVLRVAVGTIDGDPVPVVHDELKWLGADELDSVAWLESDVAFLDQVAAHLR